MRSQDSADWRPLYPFCSHYFQLGPVRMHYLDEGAGEPLLMVHGNPTWSFYWRNLVQAWRGSHRAIAIDHVGCGLSDKPQDYPYTLTTHIDNLVALIEHLDLKSITLLAHDWGGAIGLGAAERLTSRFARIVLFNTGAFPPPFVPKRIAACRIPGFGVFAVRRLNLFARAALSMATEKPERFTPAVRAGLLAPYDNWRNRVAIYRFVADIPFTPRHPTWQVLAAIESQLPTLASLPTQLIWGMRDWCFTPECLTRLSRALPLAEVHSFDDAGHYVVEDAHERIVPIVNELLRRPASG